jgi:hypothetical protein
MEKENNRNGQMENIFYAALALHVAGKPLNKENIRIVLSAAGTPVDEPTLGMIGAFIESLKASHGKGNSDSKIINLLKAVSSQQKGTTVRLETLLGELGDARAAVNTTPAPASTVLPPNPGRYIYGIATGGKDVNLGQIGINGSRVYTVTYQELSAIVHSCPLAPYQSTDEEQVKKWVIMHQNVLDAAKGHFEIIIPLGFDTIIKCSEEDVSPDEFVRDWLKRESGRFRDVITHIAGKDEYAVQISYTPALLSKYTVRLSPEALRVKNEMAGKSPGIAYIYQQKLARILKADLEKLTDAWYLDFFERIKKQTDSIKIEKNRKLDADKVMLLNLSCLVAKKKVDGLGEELEKIKNMEGFFVHFSGPWPPYSFVVEPVAATATEGPDGSH